MNSRRSAPPSSPAFVWPCRWRQHSRAAPPRSDRPHATLDDALYVSSPKLKLAQTKKRPLVVLFLTIDGG